MKLKIAFYLWMETIVVYTTALVAKIINIRIKFIVIIVCNLSGRWWMIIPVRKMCFYNDRSVRL